LSTVPPIAREIFGQLNDVRGEQMLSIVRALDSALNNTSVILLFEVGGRKLLFPGDAQYESWAYALQRMGKQLTDVDVYKVGHHGSLNGTPKSLWKLFRKRSHRRIPQRLTTLLSTLPGKHGDTLRGTEVPRRTLLTELRKNSNLYSTDETMTGDRLSRTFLIRF
jgi:hypothetical protein